MKKDKIGRTTIHNKESLFNMKEPAVLVASDYKPKVTYVTFSFPEDTRTPDEKAAAKFCEEFLLFAFDVFTWGVEDALGLWSEMTNDPPPDHPGDCADCRGTNRGFMFLGVPDEKVDAALKRAAEVVKSLK